MKEFCQWNVVGSDTDHLHVLAHQSFCSPSMISISQSSVEWEMNFTCKPHLCKAIDFNFLATPHSMRDLIFLTRDRTCAPCCGSVGSWPLDGQGIPRSHILKTVSPLQAWIPEWLCKAESPCTKNTHSYSSRSLGEIYIPTSITHTNFFFLVSTESRAS